MTINNRKAIEERYLFENGRVLMLQKLSQHIAECYDRAAACKRRAEQTTDSARQAELLDLDRTWTHLARSYEFVESLERFLLTARNHPNREPQYDPTSPDQSQTA